MRAGIVGSGISGLVCAQRLLALRTLLPDEPLQVSVLEWGRGPGGRMARRRVTTLDGREISFDHAAPCFTASSPEFRSVLRDWEREGHAARWDAAGEDVWVGRPTNHAICRALADQVSDAGGSMIYGRHVRSVRYDGGEWVLRASNRAARDGDADEEHRFDALVLSDKLLLLPNPYAVLGAEDWGPLALPTTLSSTGAVVLMLAVESGGAGVVPPLLRGAAVQGPLELLVHESAKPGREAAGLDLYVAHSTPAYLAAHLRGDDPPGLDDPEAVREEMLAAALATLAAAGGGGCAAPTVVHAQVFAWDHARPEGRVGATHLLDPARRAGVCGDFFGGEGGGEGVEAAATSGRALADALAPLL